MMTTTMTYTRHLLQLLYVPLSSSTTTTTTTQEHQQHNHHHRMLQSQQQQQPTFDFDTAIISVAVVIGMLILCCTAILFVNILVTKFCPNFGALSIRTTPIIQTPNSDDITRLPEYTYEARQLFLTITLKSHEFRASNATASVTNNNKNDDDNDDDDIEKGIEKGNGGVTPKKVQDDDDDDDDDGAKAAMKSSCDDRNSSSRSNNNSISRSSIDRDAYFDEQYYNIPQCLICFEPYVDGDLISTHCSDISYHRHCIMEWLIKHNNCPYCRRSFFTTTTTMSPTLSINSVPGIPTISTAVSTDNEVSPPPTIPAPAAPAPATEVTLLDSETVGTVVDDNDDGLTTMMTTPSIGLNVRNDEVADMTGSNGGGAIGSFSMR